MSLPSALVPQPADPYREAPELARAVHAATSRILAQRGLWVGLPALVDLARSHGLRTDGELIFFTEDEIQKALASTGRRFTLLAPNPARDVEMAGRRFAVGMGRSAPFVITADQGRRESTAADLERMLKLGQMLDDIQLTGALVYPGDLPENRRGPFIAAATLRYTDKPFTVLENGDLDFLAMVFGVTKERIAQAPERGQAYGHTTINLISPLTLGGDQAQLMLDMAGAGIPIMVTPSASAGMSGPCSALGTLILSNCEVLASLVLIQLARPGLAVLYGALPCGTDMRTMSAAYGGPEARVMEAGVAAMAHHYDLLSRANVANTDAHVCDYQAGAESAINLENALRAGHNLWTGCGILAGFAAASNAKLVLDAELAGFTRRLARPLDLAQTEELVELICRVGPRGSFLTTSHTMAHFRAELWHPGLFTRLSHKKWHERGVSLDQAADLKAEQLLANYQPPALDPDLDRRLAQWCQTTA